MILPFVNLKDCILYNNNNSPEKVALSFQKRQYTYKQLYNVINELTNTLTLSKHINGERIGIALPNSDFFIHALFAIFNIGSSAVLLNSILNIKEMIMFSNDSKISAIFLTPFQHEKLKGFQIKKQIPTIRTLFVWDDKRNKLDIIKIESKMTADKFEQVKNSKKKEDAITIYTSGTTGSSKGVLLTHFNLISNASTAVEILNIQSIDRALIAMPLCHSYALTLQVLTHLICGAYMRILPSPILPNVINQTIDADSITTFSGITYHFFGMLQRGAGKRYPMKTLRLVTSGAAFMPESLRKKWLGIFPQVDFFATYGLSEASPLVTVLPKGLSGSKPISIGRVIRDVEYKIIAMDTNGREGELLIRGPNVMKGYYNNPSATSKVIDRDGWLHTGDLVSVDDEGDMIIVGRKKEIIKRGGENIYPGEIEAVIANLPGVSDVAVVGIPDAELGERILAAIVPKDNTLLQGDIINTCWNNLAPFKVPEAFIFLERFDKTHTGKTKKDSIIAAYLRKAK